MQILNQPYEGTLGELLINNLQSEYQSFTMVSAYAKMSGVQRLQPYIENFTSTGGFVRAFIGIDQRNTSYEALILLQQLCNELYIIHSENMSHTFHQKIYIFQSPMNAWVSIGSNNLTGGGLWTNYETCMHYNYDLAINEHNMEFRKLVTLLDRYSTDEYQCSIRIGSAACIDQLLANGYILREENLRAGIISDATSTRGIRTRIFGTESFRLPALQITHTETMEPPINDEAASIINQVSDTATSPNPIIPVVTTGTYERFWFEMRASTGGSRNILDLSMIGNIVGGTAAGTRYATNDPNQMLGGVTFFDINGNDHMSSKDITISFEGTDYYPSTILFANNNGSWRLQLKGNNNNDTHALSEFGITRFAHNILIFEKIRTDYYILSVVDGNYIGDLRTLSQVYASNGSRSNAKQYGIL
ncbi:MAG: hypothetical protein AB9858_06330 [Acidaminococcaceae bacterium]